MMKSQTWNFVDALQAGVIGFWGFAGSCTGRVMYL